MNNNTNRAEQAYLERVAENKFRLAGKTAVAAGVVNAISARLDELKTAESMSHREIMGHQEMTADQLYKETYKCALHSIINILTNELGSIT